MEAFAGKPVIESLVVVLHPLDIGRHHGLDVVGRRLGRLEQGRFGLHKLPDLIQKGVISDPDY